MEQQASIIHDVIEVSDDEEITSISPADEIEDVMDAWDGLRRRSRSLGVFLLTTQEIAIKKRVREMMKYANSNDTNKPIKTTAACEMHIHKKQRTECTHDEIIINDEKERLVAKMNRLKRIGAIVRSVDKIHALLRSELEGMLEEAQQECICDM